MRCHYCVLIPKLGMFRAKKYIRLHNIIYLVKKPHFHRTKFYSFNGEINIS